MRIKLVGNKADAVTTVCKNAEATATIARGTPVVMKFGTAADGSNDGLAVVLPATAAGKSYTQGMGVALAAIAPNQVGECLVYGYCAYCLVTVLTRSASSAVWPSTASLDSGAVLQWDTANNAFSVFSASHAATNFAPFAVMLDSLASATTQASTTSGPGTVTASTAGHRVFVRML